MQTGLEKWTGWGAALAAGLTLAGCGGGGGGSASPVTSTPNPISTVPMPMVPAPPPIVTPTLTAVRQTMAGKSVIVKATRGAQASSVRPRLLVTRRGHTVNVATDVLEESLVFDSSGNPDLTQTRLLDLTQQVGAVVDTATLGDNGAFSETFHFAGTPTETDTVTGTLTPANSGASVTLANGSDVVTVGGTPTTVSLPLAGIAQTPTDPATLHLTAGTYSGSVTVTDGSGTVFSAPQLSLTFDSTGTVLGGLDYTDASNTLQTQTINGVLDAGGEFFDTSSLGAQTFSEQFTLAPAVGTLGAVTVSGFVLDQTGAVIVVYSGTLTPTP